MSGMDAPRRVFGLFEGSDDETASDSILLSRSDRFDRQPDEGEHAAEGHLTRRVGLKKNQQTGEQQAPDALQHLEKNRTGVPGRTFAG